MAARVAFLGLLANVMVFTKACEISLKTLKQSGDIEDFTYDLLRDHGFNIDNTESMTFEVKACKDAYIGLMETDNVNTSIYKVAIGAWSNQRTVLYRNKHDRPTLTRHDGRLLDCGSFKKFNLKWANKKIELRVMDGNSSWTDIISYSAPDTTRIKFIGVSTSVWGVGYWKIYNHECTENQNAAIQQVTWSQDKDRKDQTYTSPSYRITDHVSRLDCLQQCQMYSDCRYVTYNTTLCQGFSEIKLFNRLHRHNSVGKTVNQRRQLQLMGYKKRQLILSYDE